MLPQGPGRGAGVEAALAWAAKVESSFSSRFSPQEGHVSDSMSESRRMSFSKREPQSWQRYSKIGILYLVVLLRISNAIVSTALRTSEAGAV